MSNLILPRRKLLTGFAAMMAMPAIVRAENLMRLPAPVSDPDFWRSDDTFFLSPGDSVKVTVTMAVNDAYGQKTVVTFPDLMAVRPGLYSAVVSKRGHAELRQL